MEKELAECVNTVVREKAPNALARLSELLAAKAGKPVAPPLCDYLSTVGNTPLVKLSKCLPEGVKAARVLAKLEMCNPGGSLKDRIALHMIEKAEKEGLIKPGVTTLVDFTSGNTGSTPPQRAPTLALCTRAPARRLTPPCPAARQSARRWWPLVRA